jgi:hypothetical protein
MAKKSINDKLKDIEHMIPYKFNFDFGFHTTIKETYQHKSHTDDFDYKDYKIEEYLTYDYMDSAATLENKGNGQTDGYMIWDEHPLQIFPTSELIVKYSHIVFKDGRKYIVGKSKTEITDLISLFRFLQTTKNYAIFNNLLNVMLIFIIYYGIINLNFDDYDYEKKDILGTINKHYRKLYRENPENNEVRLVNSFIYEIEKKEVDYYPRVFNEKTKAYLASNWDKCFDEIVSHFQKKSGSQKSSSRSQDKEGDLTIKACKSLLEKSGYIINERQGSSSQSPDKETKISIKIGKILFEKLEYNMELGQKLIMSLQYQFIMDNIDDFPALKLDFQSKKLIYTSNKHMNEIIDVFEATYYDKTSYDLDEYNKKIKNGDIPIYIKIYSDNNKLYITYQIGEKYKRDKTPDIPLKIMQLNQLILFTNKHILKELFNLAKKGADWLPPKGSSSSSLGSPPKGGKAKKKKSQKILNKHNIKRGGGRSKSKMVKLEEDTNLLHKLPEDTNLLHNTPEEIQKRIMAIVRSRLPLNYFKSIEYEESDNSINSSNYLGDLVYRLSIKLPYRDWDLILRLLDVTDMFTFMNKASIFDFRDTISKRSNNNYIQNLIRNQINTPFTIQEEASKIINAINRLYEEIMGEQKLFINFLNNTFKGFISDSKKTFTTTKQGNREYSKVYPEVSDIDITLYIPKIMRKLKLTNVFDIIVMNKVNIKKLQQPYKDWLLLLQQLLKKKHQIFTLLMETRLFTQHEAIHVDNSLRTSSIVKTEDLMNITPKHFQQLFLLSEDKKELLNNFFQEQKNKLTKGSSGSPLKPKGGKAKKIIN